MPPAVKGHHKSRGEELRITVKILAAVSGLVAAGALLIGAPTSASASSDPGACAPNGRTVFRDGDNRPEYLCTLWQGNVPVRAHGTNNAGIVGYLNYGGRSNWFLWQCHGDENYIGSSFNNVWAYTEADNGTWGYVPETYFSGGANNQASSVLSWKIGVNDQVPYTFNCG
jgi:hypothetical protein